MKEELTFLGKTVSEFCGRYLKNDEQLALMKGKGESALFNQLARFVIGNETDRYAAEPVYAKKGVGYLKSDGVEGLLKKRQIYDFLQSDEGRLNAYLFLERAFEVAQVQRESIQAVK